MTNSAADPPIVPRPPAAAPALRAADRGVAAALESARADSTNRVYGAQWRSFSSWCSDLGLPPLRPPSPSPCGPLPGRPRRGRREHGHAAPGRLRHHQGPRMDGTAVAVPGPGRAGIFEGLGPPAGQTLASGRRSDQ